MTGKGMKLNSKLLYEKKPEPPKKDKNFVDQLKGLRIHDPRIKDIAKK